MLRALLLTGLLVDQVPEPPPRDAVVWIAPRGCLDQPRLTAAIARRLGRPLAAGELELTGTVTQHAQSPRFRVQLQLRVDEDSQVRTLTAERCSSIADATILLAALAVQRSAAATPTLPEPPPEPEPSEPVPAESVPAESVPAESVPPEAEPLPPGPAPPTLVVADPIVPLAPPPSSSPSSPRPGLLLRLHGGPEYGAVPRLSGALGLVVGGLWRRARLELGGHFVAPHTVRHDPATARLFVLAATARGCARLGRGVLEFPLCGGLELGGLRAQVTGPGARSVTGLWLAGAGAAGLVWHLRPRLGLTLALEVLVHLTRPRLNLGDPGPPETLYYVKPASARLLVGLELRLGDPW